METQSLPPNDRITLYQERAQTLRRLAKDESLGTARERMLTLAEDYRCLAELLRMEL